MKESVRGDWEKGVWGAEPRLSQQLSRFGGLSRVARERVDALQGVPHRIAEGTDLLQEGDAIHSVPMVVSGWASQNRLFADGRRSILKLELPGDLINGAFPLTQRTRFSAQALTQCEVLFYPADQLLALLEENPTVTLAFLRMEAYHHNILRERMMALAQLTAYERLAHFFLELQTRLEDVNLADADGFSLPISQTAIGELLGMHQVHVSRILKRLENDGYILRNGQRIQLGAPLMMAELSHYRGPSGD